MIKNYQQNKGSYIPLSQKGVANGVASLDGSGKVPSAQLDLTAYLTTATAGSTYIPLSQKGSASGVVPLSASSKILTTYFNTSTASMPSSDASVILNVINNVVVDDWSVFLSSNINNYLRMSTTVFFIKHDTAINLNTPSLSVQDKLKFGGTGRNEYLYRSGTDLYWFNGTTGIKLN